MHPTLMTSDPPRLEIQRVLGVPIHIPTGIPAEDSLPSYVEWLRQRLAQHQGTHVITCNSEMTMLAQRDPTFWASLHQADLVIPDGAGVVWALGRQGIRVHRSPGIELAETLLRRLAEDPLDSFTIALIGATPEVNQAAQAHWQQQYPRLCLWGQHGYLSPDQESNLLTDLEQQAPQVILVGMGSPRQEAWIQAHRQRLPNAIWMGVGGSFDIWAGNKTRAPQWWRDHRLEWLYRLYQEPWRWRRMLVLPQFVWKVWWTHPRSG
jgi:N-acetylglucosaminyldiphosphoundecaprenol N-acetyl-beta-D-mannosaminyltransferase